MFRRGDAARTWRPSGAAGDAASLAAWAAEAAVPVVETLTQDNFHRWARPGPARPGAGQLALHPPCPAD